MKNILECKYPTADISCLDKFFILELGLGDGIDLTCISINFHLRKAPKRNLQVRLINRSKYNYSQYIKIDHLETLTLI